MPLIRNKDPEQNQDNPLKAPLADKKRGPEQPAGDYSHGHPGVPPKDYKQPEESRR